MIKELNDRTRQILKIVVDSYTSTGSPIGSKAISEKMGMTLSPATIRHAMAELEELGLLYAPHTSAGRLPTDHGLTVFVEGLLELDALSNEDQKNIEQNIFHHKGDSIRNMLEETSLYLSGLSSCAGLVFAPKSEDQIQQIEFILLSPGRVLVVLVMASGLVENRIVETLENVTTSELIRATNYINTHIRNKTLSDIQKDISDGLKKDQSTLDALTAKVVASGLASFSPDPSGGHLFLKGQGQLLNDITALEDLERIRQLFQTLDTKETMQKLLTATQESDGVKIFIGAENKLFNHSGCSMIVAPYKGQDAKIVGAIGVIGPTRINYGRVIPVVNYTSHVISQILAQRN